MHPRNKAQLYPSGKHQHFQQHHSMNLPGSEPIPFISFLCYQLASKQEKGFSLTVQMYSRHLDCKARHIKMHMLCQNNHHFSKSTHKSHSVKSTDSGCNFTWLTSAAAIRAQGRSESIRHAEHSSWCETPSTFPSVSHTWAMLLLELFSNRAQKVVLSWDTWKEVCFFPTENH